MAALALSTGLVHAELAGSLLLPVGVETTAVYLASTTRTTNGDAITRGTVEGMMHLLTSHHPTNQSETAWLGGRTKSASGSCRFIEWNRYAHAIDYNGVVVWDYDFSGINVPAWSLKLVVDRYSSRFGIPEHLFYISYNGDEMTLDETDISSIDPGGLTASLDDTTKFRKIAALPYGVYGTIDTYEYDVTDMLHTAITNGGKVRLVYRDQSYKDRPRFREDSGFHATNIAFGASVNGYYVLDHFDGATGTLPVGQWSGTGPEAKEYNLSSSGILNIRDADADETGGGAHSGLTDLVSIPLISGIPLTNESDFIQMEIDLGAYADTSGASLPSGTVVKVSLTDSSVGTTNAGFGILMSAGPAAGSTANIFSHFDDPTTEGIPLATNTLSQAYDGSTKRLSMRMTKVSGEYVFLAALGSSRWTALQASGGLSEASNAEIFDTLTISVSEADVGLKIDNVAVFSNVSAPALTPYELWITGFPVGEWDAKGDDPDADGLDNFTEWALGGNPSEILDIGIDSEYSVDGTSFTYVYPSNKNGDVQGVLYNLEASDDLVVGIWTNSGITVTVGGNHSADADYVAVTNQVPVAGASERFFRLNVEDTNP